jgi:hypothetical protein
MIQSSAEYCQEVEGILNERFADFDDRGKSMSLDTEKVNFALSDFERCINELDSIGETYALNSDERLAIKNLIGKQVVMNPKEINHFYNSNRELMKYNRSGKVVPLYLDGLVQTSYDSGHNGFYFSYNSENVNINWGSDLHGRENNPIVIDVKGNVGSNFCYESSNLSVSIMGNVQKSFCKGSNNIRALVRGDVSVDACEYTENVALFVDGNVSLSCGQYSENFFVIILGDVKRFFGSNSKDLSAIVKGKIQGNSINQSNNATIETEQINGWDSFCNTNNSTLKISDKDSLLNFFHMINDSGGIRNWPFRKDTNKLILINEDCTEKQVGRFYIQW